MENQDNGKSLYIPSNIKTKTEFFKGFGVAELKKTAVMTAIVGVLFYFRYRQTDNVIVLVVAVMVSAGVGAAIFSKDERNQSMMDTLGHMLRFARQQKKYPYRFYREDWYV